MPLIGAVGPTGRTISMAVRRGWVVSAPMAGLTRVMDLKPGSFLPVRGMDGPWPVGLPIPPMDQERMTLQLYHPTMIRIPRLLLLMKQHWFQARWFWNSITRTSPASRSTGIRC